MVIEAAVKNPFVSPFMGYLAWYMLSSSRETTGRKKYPVSEDATQSAASLAVFQTARKNVSISAVISSYTWVLPNPEGLYLLAICVACWRYIPQSWAKSPVNFASSDRVQKLCPR